MRGDLQQALEILRRARAAAPPLSLVAEALDRNHICVALSLAANRATAKDLLAASSLVLASSVALQDPFLLELAAIAAAEDEAHRNVLLSHAVAALGSAPDGARTRQLLLRLLGRKAHRP